MFASIGSVRSTRFSSVKFFGGGVRFDRFGQCGGLGLIDSVWSTI